MPHDGLSTIRAHAARMALRAATQRDGSRPRLPQTMWPRWQREAYARNRRLWQADYRDRLRNAANVVATVFEPDGS